MRILWTNAEDVYLKRLKFIYLFIHLFIFDRLSQNLIGQPKHMELDDRSTGNPWLVLTILEQLPILMLPYFTALV